MSVLIDNLGLYGAAFLGTIQLFIVSSLGSLVLGLLLAGIRVSPLPVLRAFGTIYVNVLRNTPLTLVLLFFAFAYPRLEIVDLSFFARACVGLSLYTASFVCEVVRSGVNTVPIGQAEASRALGFTFTQTLSLVVLPQAVRSLIPPLTNVQIALLKNTTVAAGFSVFEAGGIYANLSERGYNVFTGLLWVAFGFVLLVVPMSLLQRNLDNRWSVAR